MDEMELWEVAAYLGLHRVETREDRDNREIVEAKHDYWERTRSQRMEKFDGYSERRRERRQARAREKRESRNVN